MFKAFLVLQLVIRKVKVVKKDCVYSIKKLETEFIIYTILKKFASRFIIVNSDLHPLFFSAKTTNCQI